MKGLDDLAIVPITHPGYLRFLVLVNTYSFFTRGVYGTSNLGVDFKVIVGSQNVFDNISERMVQETK